MMLFQEIRIPQLFIYLKTLKKERQKGKKKNRRRNLWSIRNLKIFLQFLIFFYNNQENKKQYQHKDTLKKWTSFSLHKIDSIKFKKLCALCFFEEVCSSVKGFA